jgi:TonB family protein
VATAMPFRWSDNPFEGPPSSGAQPHRGTIDLGLPPGLRDSRGKPPPPLGNLDSMARVVGAQVGPGWIQLLHEWWLRHGYYPEGAAEMGQDGTVQLHLSVDRDGRVLSVHLDSSAGSPFLDMGAQAVFRGAKLPPFPPNTPEDRAEVYLTIEYILLRR